MIELVAPAGTPITSLDLAAWLANVVSGKNTSARFTQQLQNKFNLQHSYLLSTGRASMCVALDAFAKLSADKNKNEVILPSYTCYSVVASVMKAGLVPRICDISAENLSYDLAKLGDYDFSKTLAIISANLYGIPNELDKIKQIADKHGIYMLDDAAQCMGAMLNNEYVGKFGHIGLYSLDKGKNITSIQGGILTCSDNNIAQMLNKLYSELNKPKLSVKLIDSIKLFAYKLLLPPQIYWVTGHIPFLGLGKTPFTMDYPIERYSNVHAGIAAILFNKLDHITHKRIQNAHAISEIIKQHPDLTLIKKPSNSKAVYTRLPVLAKNSTHRAKLIELFIKRGIGASESYPSTITDINEIKNGLHKSDLDTPQGRDIANRIFTLPTHPYLKEKHLHIIQDVLLEAT